MLYFDDFLGEVIKAEGGRSWFSSIVSNIEHLKSSSQLSTQGCSGFLNSFAIIPKKHHYPLSPSTCTMYCTSFSQIMLGYHTSWFFSWLAQKLHCSLTDPRLHQQQAHRPHPQPPRHHPVCLSLPGNITMIIWLNVSPYHHSSKALPRYMFLEWHHNKDFTCLTRLILRSSGVEVVGGQIREIERHFGGP